MRTQISSGKLLGGTFSFLVSVPGEQEARSLVRQFHLSFNCELNRKTKKIRHSKENKLV